MLGSCRGQVLQRGPVPDDPKRQAGMEAWAPLPIHDPRTTVTTGLGHPRLAMQEPTGTVAAHPLETMDGTTNTALQEARPPVVETHMQVSLRQLGRRDMAPVASKYPQIGNARCPGPSRHLCFMAS
jgi:hypothetical protein